MLRKVTPRRDLELSVVLVGEKEILDLNLRYLGKDEVTDVLSFPQMSPMELGQVASGGRRAVEPLGDIAICVPVASRYASERGSRVEEEVELLAAHGLLHLVGYGDESEEGAREMEVAEKRLVGRSIIGGC